MALTAFVPQHQDHALLLLELLGFERRGTDRHGRETFCHALEDATVRAAAQEQAWLLPDPVAEMPDGPIRRQLLRTAAAHEPAGGDLLLFYERAGDQVRSASLTAAARVRRVRHARELQELLALTAGREGASMTRQRELLDAGPVSVLDLRWVGRLARPIAVSALIERGIIASTPAAALALETGAMRRLAPELVLA